MLAGINESSRSSRLPRASARLTSLLDKTVLEPELQHGVLNAAQVVGEVEVVEEVGVVENVEAVEVDVGECVLALALEPVQPLNDKNVLLPPREDVVLDALPVGTLGGDALLSRAACTDP